MAKILLLLIGIGIGYLIATKWMRRDRGDLTAPPRRNPPPRLDAPLAHKPPPVNLQAADIDDAEILALVRNGRKIEAIKLLRDRQSLGLADAKDIVDELEKTLR